MLLSLIGATSGATAADCGAIRGQTIRWIVPNAPGGGYDAYSRLVQPLLEKRLGASIVMINRPEAGGLVGATVVRDARPDGRTLGIVNASGLLAASLDGNVPDPAADFTVLGRILRNQTVLLTGRDSGIRDVAALFHLAAQRPLVIGVRDAGSNSLLAVPVVAKLLGIDYQLVTGYVGSSARTLAAIRGEVDVILQTYDSVHRFVEDEELRPLLQVTDAPVTPDGAGPIPALEGIPSLGGETGVAQSRTHVTGLSRADAIQQARGLAAIIDAGRLIVAPTGLSAETADCLRTAVADVFASNDLQAAAQRANLRIEPVNATAALVEVGLAKQAMAQFAPSIRAAMREARR